MGPQFDISTILLTLIIWKLPKRGVGSTGPSPPSSPDYQSDLENRFYGPNNPQFNNNHSSNSNNMEVTKKRGGEHRPSPLPALLIVNLTSKIDSTAQITPSLIYQPFF